MTAGSAKSAKTTFEPVVEAEAGAGAGVLPAEVALVAPGAGVPHAAHSARLANSAAARLCWDEKGTISLPDVTDLPPEQWARGTLLLAGAFGVRLAAGGIQVHQQQQHQQHEQQHSDTVAQ